MSFADTVAQWAQQEGDRLEAIFQTSVQIAVNELRRPIADGGRMPVQSGNLRRSLSVSKFEMPSIKPDQADFTDDDIAGVILALFLGDTAFVGFQAAYAARAEFGFVGEDSLGRLYNQTGHGFVSAVSQRWNQIVQEAEAVVNARSQQR
ncbi:hypothetical protein HF259_06230 [Rhizobium leguminosarum]|uniref:hypothetical protein n=1 Tax=Rhizobium leguminosarum TaxID=384 RepID=UPI001C92520D|nr:hypothetical protein [Rhizobium leguminosarum]MBY2921036.1 hypothetical protein [Rhizobium leguminosarum]